MQIIKFDQIKQSQPGGLTEFTIRLDNGALVKVMEDKYDSCTLSISTNHKLTMEPVSDQEILIVNPIAHG